MIINHNFECPKVDDIKKDTERRLECRKKCFDENKEEFEQFIISSLNNITSSVYDIETHTLAIKSTEKLNMEEVSAAISDFVSMHGSQNLYTDWNYYIIPYAIADSGFEYDILL